ncbi:ABC transporter substrate-binding protein [Microlunatus flavus]|uniref:Multiple sugar transport system substrate-binding protein n=1 Tax=Microlunatus flavus TaxID=1036181 RepID=A0A1H9FGP2_9ACTN|nr:extracellular solute-binding protein [Microlunatus flavus]SEQ37069.1 multiple sugar transport system substrate-binding protein [Microlunatus flavus]
MIVSTPWRRGLVATLVAGLLVLLSGCVQGDARNTSPDSIKVWIVEDLPDRVAATQRIVDDFTRSSGVQVQLVAVAEDQFNQLLLSSAAAGTLPDVVGGVPLGQVRTMSSNELLDPAATAAVLDDLGRDTFTRQALDLTSDRGTPLAVPSEAWTQLLLYRKDLFDAKGLAAPTTYESVRAAAQALKTPDQSGFIGATVAGDSFTEQTFEYWAQANGCQLVDDTGKVTFDSPACVEALRTYGQLVREDGPPGAQDVDTTRASYFAGRSAMTVWSTFILDEMAGLRDDAKPTCPQCEADPAFLAKNTGIVTAIKGPQGARPTVFGEVTSWVITAAASAGPARRFVEHMMSDGYQPWIAIAPEGKVPVRTGTADDRQRFSKAWAGLDVGVDSRAPLSRFYSPEVIDEIASGPQELSRWAIPQGQGDLLGALQGEQPVAEAVNEVSNGTDPAQAARQATDTVVSIQESLQ